MLTLDRGSQLALTLVAAVTTFVAVVAKLAIVPRYTPPAGLPLLTVPFNIPNIAVRRRVHRCLRRLTRSERAHLEHAVVLTRYIERIGRRRTLLVEYSRLTNVEEIADPERLDDIQLHFEPAFEHTFDVLDGLVPAVIWEPSFVSGSHRLLSPPPSPLLAPVAVAFNFEPATSRELSPAPLAPASITPATHPEYFPPEF